MKKDTQSGKILVVDDSPVMHDVVRKTLSDEYDIIDAYNGLQALDIVAQHADISCIIMGLMMPELDGFQTTHRLKSNFATYHIPIIILTSHIGAQDMTRAVAMGADDYMRKPIDPVELKERLIMNLRRAERDQNANPLTKLPGNAIINRTIVSRLGQPLAILYADLDNFKAYNDKYGFDMGDVIIKKTAEVLTFAVKNFGTPNDFLGHIGGDDFIIISTPTVAEAIAKNICQRFDEQAPAFYNEEDRLSKKIISRDRQGVERAFPLVSISIAIVTNEKKELTSAPQVAQLAAELKHYAKSKPAGELGSNFVKERRSS